MGNYLNHLKQLSTPATFQSKKNYCDYNIGPFLPKQVSNSKILEIGPGLGEFVSFLNDRGGFNIDVVDNDREVLKFVSKNYRISKAIVSKNIGLLGRRLNNYDLIVLIQVLEHLPVSKHPAILRTLYSHLNKLGHLVIVVPNANNPLGLTERYSDVQHTSSFSTQALLDLIDASGIKKTKVQIRGYEIPPYRVINLIRILLQKILHGLLLLIMVINGGLFFKVMTPNIMLVIKKS